MTGAGGQLGRALGPALAGHEVVALPRAELDIGDLAAVRAAVAAHRPSVVVNAAAYNLVDQAESEPEAAERANAIGPRNLALAAAERGAAILHVSSDYVFDGEQGRPYHERDAPNPLSAYGRSKLEGELAVREANPRHLVVRTAWVYAAVGRNFPNTIRRLAEAGPVRVVDDQTGSPTYAPHLALGLARLLSGGGYGTYHLAGSGAATWHDFAVARFAALRVACAVERAKSAEFPRPARRPRFAPLVTVREPPVLLPPWQEGVVAYTRAVAA
ncbi:MAG TPA: dTDP-4-dehydrorhamnose reductase [Vicinamibacteria bacterium]|nr:dTDP-4-dehydrorhamnose reductase [Vicinamibacteria bacterium]